MTQSATLPASAISCSSCRRRDAARHTHTPHPRFAAPVGPLALVSPCSAWLARQDRADWFESGGGNARSEPETSIARRRGRNCFAMQRFRNGFAHPPAGRTCCRRARPRYGPRRGPAPPTATGPSLCARVSASSPIPAGAEDHYKIRTRDVGGREGRKGEGGCIVCLFTCAFKAGTVRDVVDEDCARRSAIVAPRNSTESLRRNYVSTPERPCKRSARHLLSRRVPYLQLYSFLADL